MTAILDELKEHGKTGLYIGGSWSSGAGELPVVDPATEDVLVDVGLAEASHAEDAVDAAADALGPGRPRRHVSEPRSSAAPSRRCGNAKTTLAELIVLENGKAFPDALGEVRYAAEFFRWFSEEAPRIGGEVRLAPAGDKRIMTVLQPVGVSVMITPWNFPAAMATRKIGPGSRRRMHRHRQAGLGHPADHARRRPPHGGGGAAARGGERRRRQRLVRGDRADAA